MPRKRNDGANAVRARRIGAEPGQQQAGDGVERVWRLTQARWPLPLLALLLCVSGCEAAPHDRQPNAEQQAVLDAAVRASPPAAMIGIEARFGDALELVGYLLEPASLTQQAGHPVSVTLVWRCDRRPALGYRFFTHLTDAAGRVLVNLDDAGPLRRMPGVDGPPSPPWRCKPGRYLLDRLTLKLPASAPPHIQLRVGLYQGSKRLPATGGAADRASDSALIKLTVTGGNPQATSAAHVPQLVVYKLPAGEVPRIDGVLDEPLWQRAAHTDPFVHAGTGELLSGPPRGSARLSYDDDYLYVAFEVIDHTLRGGFAPDAIDPQLWTRDTVELMIDPDGDGDNRDYYEIQINPQNLIFDSHFDRYNAPRAGPAGPFGHQDWRADMRSAVSLRGTLDDDSDRDEGYLVEAAIKWSSFHKARRVPPRSGDSWRMNFYAMQDNGGAAWSALLGQGNFHRASRFGKIIFR